MPPTKSAQRTSTKCVILLCIVVAAVLNVLLIATYEMRGSSSGIARKRDHGAASSGAGEGSIVAEHRHIAAVADFNDSPPPLAPNDDEQLQRALLNAKGDEFAQRLVRIEHLMGVRLRITAAEAREMTTTLRRKLKQLPLNEETPTKLASLLALRFVKDTEAGTSRSKKANAGASGFADAAEIDKYFAGKNAWRRAALARLAPRCTMKHETFKAIDGASGNTKEVGVTYNVVFPRHPMSSDGEGHAPYTAIAVLFHGCAHSSRDFCKAEASECVQCIGLPEERAAVADALALGMVVVAVSSGTPTGCWKQSGFFARKDKKDTTVVANADLWNVLAALKAEGMLAAEDTHAVREGPAMHTAAPSSLALLPIVLMGASSGGSVLRHVAKTLGPRVIGVVPQISTPQLNDVVDYSTDMGKLAGTALLSRPYRATVLYSEMSRDSTIAGAKAQVRKMLHPKAPKPQADDDSGGGGGDGDAEHAEHAEQEEQQPAAAASVRPLVAQLTPEEQWAPLCAAALNEPHMARLKVGGELSGTLRSRAHAIAIEPLPVTEGFFSGRIGEDVLPHSVSAKLVAGLGGGGWLREMRADDDRKLEGLEQDPRKSKWRGDVKKVLAAAVEDAAHEEEGAKVQHPLGVPSSSLRDALKADKSPIAEALNVAYGRHEFFSDHLLTLFSYALCISAEQE